MPVSDSNSTNIFLADGSFSTSATLTELRLADGRSFHIPTALLSEPTKASLPSSHASDTAESRIVVPLIEEQITVSKSTVTIGTVRLEKTVGMYDVALDEPLAVSTWSVDRVALNLPVDAPPPVRQDGNTTIYPLLEEQLVLTKQLILKEEIHVTRNDFERRDTQTVTLRREQLTVERDTLS
jgi:uncharacterized protein (TIGR02271 family)